MNLRVRNLKGISSIDKMLIDTVIHCFLLRQEAPELTDEGYRRLCEIRAGLALEKLGRCLVITEEDFEKELTEIIAKHRKAQDEKETSLWVSVESKKPEHNGMFNVFGTLCKGTPHESKGKFIAYWDGEAFTDAIGDDFIGIKESVEYWFDFKKVADPE